MDINVNVIQHKWDAAKPYIAYVTNPMPLWGYIAEGDTEQEAVAALGRLLLINGVGAAIRSITCDE